MSQNTQLKASDYVSCIRIDGVPIIGPVMTDERRAEMRTYRSLAIARESELRKNKLFPRSPTNLSINVSGPEELPKSSEICKSLEFARPAAVVETEQSNDSTYLIIDGNTNTIPVDSKEVEQSSMLNNNMSSSAPVLVEPESEMSFQSCASKYIENASGYSSDDSTFRSDRHRCSSTSTAMLEDYTTDASNFTVDGRTNKSTSISSFITSHLDESLTKTSEVTTETPDFPRPSFIRSNSYTIDTPSPVFLKHLQEQGLDKDNNRSVMNEKQDKEDPEKVPSASASISSSIPIKSQDICHTAARNTKSTAALKSKESWVGSTKRRQALERVYGKRMYHPGATATFAPKPGTAPQRKPGLIINGLALEGMKVKATEKILASQQNSTQKPVSRQASSSKLTAPVPESRPKSQEASLPLEVSIKTPKPIDSDRIIEMIQQMESDRKRQMDELVQRQEFEQRRLQDTFLQQQQLLISQITERCSNMMTTCQQQVTSQLQEVITAVSPMSRRNSYCSEPVDEENNNRDLGGGDWATAQKTAGHISGPRDLDAKSNKFGIARRLFDATSAAAIDEPAKVDLEQSSEWRAATKINALARGFLTRRLFRTEDVQTIVKVIRDTLLFVIDLHHESNHHVEEDVSLKRSLLKQLNSACHMLHEIFFRKTIEQRMEIISTDRRIQRRKMLQKAAFASRGTRKLDDNANPHRTDRPECLSKLSTIVL